MSCSKGGLLGGATVENPNSSKIYLSNQDLFTPVNPLIIATTICLSIIRGDDFKLILGRYTCGFAIPELELELFKLPSFLNEKQLNNFLFSISTVPLADRLATPTS